VIELQAIGKGSDEVAWRWRHM